MSAQIRDRAAALFEVLGIYAAGWLVTEQLSRILGVSLVNPLENFTADITDTGLITASRQMFVLLMLQYAGWFVLIVPINWWHRRRSRTAYGLTRAHHSFAALAAAGLAVAALAEWPVLSVSLLDSIYDLGKTVPWRQALFDTSWRRWEYWLFTGVMSWGFVAFAEELFYRGYCQRRLAEDWGDGAAIVGVACLFTFAHSQYLLPNAYSIGMAVALFVLAIGFGVVFAWTRSLIPSFVAHAIINTTMTPLWKGVLLAAFMAGILILARQGAAVVRGVFSGAGVASSVALALVGASFALAVARIEGIEFAAVGMIALALGLETLERRKRIAKSESTSA